MAQKRPAPRKSTLSAQHPAEPAGAKAQPTPETQAPRNEPAKKWRHKVSVYQDPDFTDRMRGAITYTIPQEGPRTLSDFINAAIEAEVERLEAKYNNGAAFPPVGAKGIAQGRPMGTD